MSFFRKSVDLALDHETASQIAEQQRALEANPDWAPGYYHLAQLLRVAHHRDEAKRYLLIALEKDPKLADAHIALGEIYIMENDFTRAREHADYAARFGNSRLLAQFDRNSGK